MALGEEDATCGLTDTTTLRRRVCQAGRQAGSQAVRQLCLERECTSFWKWACSLCIVWRCDGGGVGVGDAVHERVCSVCFTRPHL